MNRLLRHSKLALLIVILALVGIVTAATPAAHAGPEPSITAYSTGSEISVVGSGFTPSTSSNPNPQVQLEVLTPDLRHVLGTATANVNIFGEINVLVAGHGVFCVTGYRGQVLVAAGGQPGPTAWAQTYASFPPTCTGHFGF
jgi:hypothetical protein